MIVIDPQYLADNVMTVWENAASIDQAAPRQVVRDIVGNRQKIEAVLGKRWLQFFCAACNSWQDDGLRFGNGLTICMDCMTEPYDDMKGTNGTRIKLLSGAYLDLKNPDPEDIHIDDIVSGISNISRYSGQIYVDKWYSVAEHSVMCYRVAKDMGFSPSVCKHILMHDTTEGYLGDLSKPLKRMLPVYKWLEKKVEGAIEKRFGLDFKSNHDSIKLIDNALLLAERFAIYGDDGVQWQDQDTFLKVDDFKPLYLKPMDIKEIFMEIWNSCRKA